MVRVGKTKQKKIQNRQHCILTDNSIQCKGLDLQSIISGQKMRLDSHTDCQLNISSLRKKREPFNVNKEDHLI